MATLKIEKRYKCSKCGRSTEWDDALGDTPLCVKCWDNDSLSEYKEKVAAGGYSAGITLLI